MSNSIRPGDVLAGRYRLVDLLTESGGGRFWRAHDRVLERHVALHVIPADDERADALLDAAKRSATVRDRRPLRVLDADRTDELCYVVNEWGSGDSLDIMLASGPLESRRAAWLVSEVAASVAAGHAVGLAHGRLIPENVLVDQTGGVRLIGFGVDAAMHGLPPGRITTDVADLGGLLYCALTGKWPGVSPSAVPPAPLEHGQILRPRQVRAGVPRPLDSLCDEVVNPFSGPRATRLREQFDLATAQGIADYLSTFVGDATGLAEAEAAAGHRENETVTLPALTDPPIRPAVTPEPAPGPDAEPAAGPDLPTEAGLPIFEDDDAVSWLTRPGEPAPPPPPFEEPPERPLFAPGPGSGGPIRTPRPSTAAAAAAAGRDFWPWDSTGPGTGTGMTPATEGASEEVPGRNWMRLAAAIAACLLLLVAVVVVYNLGRGRSPLGSVPPDDTTTTPSVESSRSTAPQPIADLTATDFDPQGDPPEENPDLAPLAVDGDPTTAWRTQTYKQNFGPGGLKTGVGLILDLGSSRSVSEVDLTLIDSPTDVSLFLSDEKPASVADLEPVASITGAGTGETIPIKDASGRYLTVWLTAVPQVPDGFRGQVAEVAVKG